MKHLTETTETTETVVSEQNGGSLAARLKEATWDLHHEVEHGSEVNRRIVTKIRGEGNDTEREREEYRATYLQFLKAAYGFEHAVLQAVRTFSMHSDLTQSGYPAEAADAVELLHMDIAFLEENGPEPRSPEYFPEIRSVAELAGVEYVRRGSRNGNAYIAHAVRGNLAYDRENGAAFLNLDQGMTRPNWERFKGWLDSLELEEHEIEQAIAAAKAAFTAVGKWHAECALQTA